MEKKRRVLIVALVSAVLLVCVAVGTYARYLSKGNGNSTITVAKWAVKVNTQNITAPGETEFNAPIIWEGLDGNVVEGYVAPGMTGSTTITIDPEGSQVSMNYWVDLDISEIDPNNTNIKLNSIKVAGVDLTPEPAGSCSDGVSLTEIECAGDNVWTANPHAGMYGGTIVLPAGNTTMTNEQAVSLIASLEWDDQNSDVPNAMDTVTGVAANGIAKNVDLKVIVEQKVD